MNSSPKRENSMVNTFTSRLKRILMGMALLFAVSTGSLCATNFAFVLNDSLGKPVESKPVELLIELTTGAIDGQAQYAENHTLSTDAAGLAAFDIGAGKPTDAKFVFDNFDIAQGTNYLRVSVKEAGGWRLLLKSQVPNVPKIRKWLFADEKSNTVIAVMIVVWLGIVVYLLLSGRKMRTLEKQLAELKQRRGQAS
jgi:CcmD family protein